MSEAIVRYATVDDVATTLGRPVTEPVEISQVEAWIWKVQRRIRRRLGPLDLLDEDALTDVISEVVARRVRNPEGKRTERIDDYSYSLDVDAARSGLYITEEEWELLMPDVDPNAAFTINPDFEPWAVTKAVPRAAGDWR